MRFLNFILVILLLFIFSACGKEEDQFVNKEDCPTIHNAKILSDSEKQKICPYNDVYRYQSEMYTVCVCKTCECFKHDHNLVVNCDGSVSLCHFNDNNCMDDFFQNAEYLFSVKGF